MLAEGERRWRDGGMVRRGRRGLRDERLPGGAEEAPPGGGQVRVQDRAPEAAEQHAGGRGAAEAHTGAERHDPSAAEEVAGPGQEDREDRDGDAQDAVGRVGLELPAGRVPGRRGRWMRRRRQRRKGQRHHGGCERGERRRLRRRDDGRVRGHVAAAAPFVHPRGHRVPGEDRQDQQEAVRARGAHDPAVRERGTVPGPGPAAGRAEAGRGRAGRHRAHVPREHDAHTRHGRGAARAAGLRRAAAVRGGHRGQRERVPDGLHRAQSAAEFGRKPPPPRGRFSGVGHVGLKRGRPVRGILYSFPALTLYIPNDCVIYL